MADYSEFHTGYSAQNRRGAESRGRTPRADAFRRAMLFLLLILALTAASSLDRCAEDVHQPESIQVPEFADLPELPQMPEELREALENYSRP